MLNSIITMLKWYFLLIQHFYYDFIYISLWFWVFWIFCTWFSM